MGTVDYLIMAIRWAGHTLACHHFHTPGAAHPQIRLSLGGRHLLTAAKPFFHQFRLGPCVKQSFRRGTYCTLHHQYRIFLIHFSSSVFCWSPLEAINCSNSSNRSFQNFRCFSNQSTASPIGPGLIPSRKTRPSSLSVSRLIKFPRSKTFRCLEIAGSVK